MRKRKKGEGRVGGSVKRGEREFRKKVERAMVRMRKRMGGWRAEKRKGRALEMEKQRGQGMNRRGKVDMWRYLALAPSK